MKAPITRLTLLCAALLLSSCANLQQKTEEPPAEPTKTSSLWGWDDKADAKTKGPLSMTVVLGEQKVKIYRGKKQIGWSYIASGVAKYPTPVGTFEILERTADKHSNLYGKIYDAKGKVVNSDAKMGRDPIPEGGRFQGARMAYWMRLSYDGLGLHVGPIPHPGRRASHGCMRLPRDAAMKIYNTVRKGTPVYIVQNEGDRPVRYVPPKPKAKPAPTTKPADPAAPVATPTEATPVETIAKPEVRAPGESILPAVPVTPSPAPAPTPVPGN